MKSLIKIYEASKNINSRGSKTEETLHICLKESVIVKKFTVSLALKNAKC